ncbi:hypothetical protein ACFLRY_02055 [Bacteroidota bacterium]
MKKSFIIIILFLLGSSIISQDIKYKVFFFNGEISFKRYEGSLWNKFNDDDLNFTLLPTDSIFLGNEAELFLIDNANAQYIFSDPGKNKISVLTDSIEALGGESLIGKYADFIWDELNKAKDDFDNYTEKHMREKGGVSRAINIPEIYSPIYGTFIIDDKISFIWENTGVEKYTLSFWDSDMNGNCFFSVAIEDTFATIPTKLPWMPEDGNLYYYSITESNKDATNFIPLKVLNNTEKEKIESDIEQIRQDLNQSVAIQYLIIASYYEENNLLDKAKQSYLQALEENDNAIIQRNYILFQARNR